MCDTMPDSLYWAGKLGAGRVRMSTQPYGIEGAEPPSSPRSVPAVIIRGVLYLPSSTSPSTNSLLDAAGRKALDLRPGVNDVSRLAPGVYFVREQPGHSYHAQTVRGVVLVK